MKLHSYLVVAATLLTGLFGSARSAFAVTTDCSAQNVIVDKVTRSIAAYQVSTYKYYVSQKDCNDGDAFTFPYTLTSAAVSSGNSLEVWIAPNGTTDCTQSTARDNTSGAVQCVKIGNGIPASSKNFGNIVITSAQIAAAISDVSGCVYTGSGTDPIPTTIYFMLVPGGNAAVATADICSWTDTAVDLTGPPAPTNVTAGAGDTIASLKYDVSSNTTDILGYQFFCEEAIDSTATTAATGATSTTADVTVASVTSNAATVTSTATAGGAGGATTSTTSGGGQGGAGGVGGMGGMGGMGGGSGTTAAATSAASTAAATAAAVTVDAAATTDAGSVTSTSSAGGAGGGAAASTNADCPTVDLMGGVTPTLHKCGETDGLAGSGTAKGLTDKVKYAVGVAAVDNLGNVGPLSPLVCVTPTAVDDFFTLYSNAGGKAGGCVLSSPDDPETDSTEGVGLVVGLGATALTILRRKRRHNTRRPPNDSASA